MSRVITIDPGKSKCGLVLAEISEKKVYKAIILKFIALRFKSLSPKIALAITSPFLTINLFSNKSGDTKT